MKKLSLVLLVTLMFTLFSGMSIASASGDYNAIDNLSPVMNVGTSGTINLNCAVEVINGSTNNFTGLTVLVDNYAVASRTTPSYKDSTTSHFSNVTVPLTVGTHIITLRFTGSSATYEEDYEVLAMVGNWVQQPGYLTSTGATITHSGSNGFVFNTTSTLSGSGYSGSASVTWGSGTDYKIGFYARSMNSTVGGIVLSDYLGFSKILPVSSDYRYYELYGRTINVSFNQGNIEIKDIVLFKDTY